MRECKTASYECDGRKESPNRAEESDTRDRVKESDTRDRGEEGDTRDRGEEGDTRDRGEEGDTRDTGEESEFRGRKEDNGNPESLYGLNETLESEMEDVEDVFEPDREGSPEEEVESKTEDPGGLSEYRSSEDAMSEEGSSSNEESTPKGRKRVRRPKTWKNTKRITRRNSGKSYTSAIGKQVIPDTNMHLSFSGFS